MKILSVDTSSNICSIAILENDKLLYEKSINSGLTHSEKLMPMINEGFNSVSININDIDIFACSKGPGSFTGIRIGIATIKSFTDVFNKPSIGITSLESLAHNIKNEGIICSLIDAKNNNIYGGIFKLENNKYTLINEYIADTIDNTLEKLKEIINSNNIDELKTLYFVGDGSDIYKNEITSKFNNAILANEEQNKLNATNIALIASNYFSQINNGDTTLYNKDISFSPLYLRKSQAERMLDMKKNQV